MQVEDFWVNPLWEEGAKKHRLGLRPIIVGEWLNPALELAPQ